MSDITTHADYNFKYNIIEEKFGLKIRNGDRFDRFFRECEWKTSLVHAGFDILVWEDFSTETNNSIIEKLKLSLSYIKKNGLVNMLKKVANKILMKVL